MAQYFRIKEISAPATVLRQGNPLNVFLGDFIYPEEVSTLVCANTVVYWDDNTGEHFTVEPGTVAEASSAPPAPPAAQEPVVSPAPVDEEVPAPLEAGSEIPQTD